MKVLILIKQPLVKRDFNRYGIEFLLSKGHEITILDLSDLVHPETPNDRTEEINDSRIEIRKIGSQKLLKFEKKTFSGNDLIINLIQSLGVEYSTYIALNMIAKSGTPYLIFAPSVYPGAIWERGDRSGYKTFQDYWLRLKTMNIFNSILYRLPRQFIGIREADYIVYNGNASQMKNELVGEKTTPIFAHTMDFDLFLNNKKSIFVQENIAVFIDQALPNHPGFISLKIAGKINADAYYRKLRMVFDAIENHLNLRVVIAGHPRSDLRNIQTEFGDREVSFGKTVDLIAKSRIVLAHYSTAIGLAVLFQKPVMLLANKEMYDLHPKYKYVFEKFSNVLGVPINFFDEPDEVNLSNLLYVNEKLYEGYINEYLKACGSPSRSLWEIVHNKIGLKI